MDGKPDWTEIARRAQMNMLRGLILFFATLSLLSLHHGHPALSWPPYVILVILAVPIWADFGAWRCAIARKKGEADLTSHSD